MGRLRVRPLTATNLEIYTFCSKVEKKSYVPDLLLAHLKEVLQLVLEKEALTGAQMCSSCYMLNEKQMDSLMPDMVALGCTFCCGELMHF